MSASDPKGTDWAKLMGGGYAVHGGVHIQAGTVALCDSSVVGYWQF